MMRAKMQVTNVKAYDGSVQEDVELSCVSEKPYDPEGESEDNTFARWTPTGGAHLTIQNPALAGKLKVGQKFYVDFTLATDTP